MSQSSSQYEQYKARELTAEELAAITEEMKKGLIAAPNTEGSIWVEKEGKNGKKYNVAKGNEMIGVSIPFYQIMLKDTGTGITHHIFEGQQFSRWSDGSVSRSPYSPRAPFAKGGTAAKPKYLEQLYGGDIEQINFYLDQHKDENWELFPTAINGQIIVCKYKQVIN